MTPAEITLQVTTATSDSGSAAVVAPFSMRFLANVSRPDLVSADVAPNPNHGFMVGLPPAQCEKMTTGKHTIKASTVVNGVEWELSSSPRCICDFKPCAC